MQEKERRSEKDAPLRHDIHVLGDALGRVIRLHRGDTVYETVEQLRQYCKRQRDCADSLVNASEQEASRLRDEIATLDRQITYLVDSCDLDTTIDVIRAFTVYFHLVNTAEQYHRTRRRRVHEVQPDPTFQHGSLAALVAFFKRNGLEATQIQSLLDNLSIELVLTAHPTEAT